MRLKLSSAPLKLWLYIFGLNLKGNVMCDVQNQSETKKKKKKNQQQQQQQTKQNKTKNKKQNKINKQKRTNTNKKNKQTTPSTSPLVPILNTQGNFIIRQCPYQYFDTWTSLVNLGDYLPHYVLVTKCLWLLHQSYYNNK